MGSFSPAMLRPLGIPCNVYPAKGYSATFPIVRPDAAPVVSLTDSSHKIVFAAGRPVAHGRHGRAVGLFRGLNTARCEALTRLARQPDALDFERVGYVGPAPVQRAHHRPQSYPQFVCQHGTRYARLDDGCWPAWLTWSAGASLNRNFLGL